MLTRPTQQARLGVRHDLGDRHRSGAGGGCHLRWGGGEDGRVRHTGLDVDDPLVAEIVTAVRSRRRPPAMETLVHGLGAWNRALHGRPADANAFVEHYEVPAEPSHAIRHGRALGLPPFGVS